MLTRRVRRWSSGDGVGGRFGGFRVAGALCLLFQVRGDIDQHPIGGSAATSQGFPARGPCDWYPLMSRSPHSSGDRAPPSGGGSAGSNPAGGAWFEERFSGVDLHLRGNVRCHSWSRRATGCHAGTVPAPLAPPGSWLVLRQGLGHAGDPEVVEGF